MDKLTPRQKDVYDFIVSFHDATGLPPTRAEISQAMGFRSANAASDHLKALSRKGAIDILPGASRGIRVMNVAEQGMPLIGRVVAGNPIFSEEHIEARYQVDPKMFQPKADYLLRVKGMSMRDAGIFDGDLLAVHCTGSVRNGQVVVARLGNEVTIKRFERRGNKVKLHPENPKFSVIEVNLKDDSFEIEGISVGVIRNKSS